MAPHPPPPPPSPGLWSMWATASANAPTVVTVRYHAARTAVVRASMADVRLWRFLSVLNLGLAGLAVWARAWSQVADHLAFALLAYYIAFLVNRHRAMSELLGVQPRHADRVPLTQRIRHRVASWWHERTCRDHDLERWEDEL